MYTLNFWFGLKKVAYHHNTRYISFLSVYSEIKPEDDVEEVKRINVKELKSYIRRDSLTKSKKLLEFLKQLKRGRKLSDKAKL
jgi:hypothetical protein